jgi:hypothetical protein
VQLSNGVTKLDDIGIYSVHYLYRDGVGGSMPDGWTGMFYGATGISCTPDGSQDGKQCFLIHPPWRNGTGVTDQTFLLKLPQARKIELAFSIAMSTYAVGKSDGATFRCFVDGQKLLDENKKDAIWSNYQFDLSHYAGKTIELRFECDPGPKNDPSFDYAFWGDRRISITGALASANIKLPSFTVTPLTLLSTPSSTAAPGISTKHIAPATISRNGQEWSTPVPGAKNLVYRIKKSDPLRISVINSIGRQGGRSFDLSSGLSLDFALSDGKTISDTDSSVTHHVESVEFTNNKVIGVIRYAFMNREVNLRFSITPKGQGLAETFSTEDPYIAALSVGGIANAAFRKQVVVPYLGVVNYLLADGVYTNTILDWTKSHATSIDGLTASYGALTDGSRNALEETAYLAVSGDIDAVLPNPPNPASPYRHLLGDKVILDVWGGNFADNAAWLRELASYRLTHFDTIIHAWQHGGYDNELPNVMPANAGMGGDEGMKEWVSTAVQLGELIGLHENYVDFYPNAALYNPKDLALDADGKPQAAWDNLIQSYAMKPTEMMKYARPMTSEVQSAFHENGGYLDVHSAVPPWFHVDMEAGQPGAGEFITRVNATRELWQLFRDVHHGPVLGEGNNHWYWSGLLDGAEAQFGTGVPGNGGETAPLFVDFDLLKIHPLQFNHGMGYIERWQSTGYSPGWESRMPTMKTLDQYRMQEVAYGHAGFVAGQLWRNLSFVWQEHNLMWPTTKRYADARVSEILYQAGNKMVNASLAAAQGSAYDRVMVKYNDGLTIWANSRDANWTIHPAFLSQSITLPQYGWIAAGPHFLAGTWLREGVVSDVNRDVSRIFVNARTTVTAPPQPLAVHPFATDFRNLGERRFEIRYNWKIGAKMPAGQWVIFTHLVAPGEPKEGIVAQPGQSVTPPDEWKAGTTVSSALSDVTLPDDLKDGVYELRTGIYNPNPGGDRLSLEGNDDGGHRYLLGTLNVTENGQRIQFTLPPPPSKHAQDFSAHTNTGNRTLDFGGIMTNGSVLLEKQKSGRWLLTPFPRNKDFQLVISAEALGMTGKTIFAQAIDAHDKPIGKSKVTAIGHGRYQIKMGMPDAAHYVLSISK